MAGPPPLIAALVSPGRLAKRLAGATLAQAARMVEQLAWRAGRRGEVGHDMVPGEEPIRFAASERMHLVASDLAEAVIGAAPGTGQVRLVANVLGLAGATPALPPGYSELQLQRRRARDQSFSHFLNMFDHRALSFFYRITRKYRWPLLAERAGFQGLGADVATGSGDPGHGTAGHGIAGNGIAGLAGSGDPVRDMLVAMAGLAVPGARERLGIEDALLVPQAANLANHRRSARAVESTLRALTGYPLRVIEGWPVWMAVPAGEQSRLGLRHASLGDAPQTSGVAMSGPGTFGSGGGGAVMIGSAVLDVQHHYVIEIGPLGYDALYRFCASPQARETITRITMLAAGIEQRPILRLLVAVADIPPLQLGGAGDAKADGRADGKGGGAMLGRTTWMGRPETEDGLARDCTIAVSIRALV